MEEIYKTIRLDSVESTNTYAKNLPQSDSRTPLLIVSDNQTDGRGQRGNSWESKPGDNLTFSLVVYPTWLAPAHQFELSMLVSIGIVNALRPYLDSPAWLRIKWPNDIYFGDRKLAGILLENSIANSSIERSVIGIGLNVNQKAFKSDAPNPISMVHATGLELDREELLRKTVESILDMIDSDCDDPEPDELEALYNSLLWRNDGRPHRWRDAAGNVFDAVVAGVDLDGTLRLTDAEGVTRGYLFKEVFAVL